VGKWALEIVTVQDRININYGRRTHTVLELNVFFLNEIDECSKELNFSFSHLFSPDLIISARSAYVF
jgi:hypothetical protein